MVTLPILFEDDHYIGINKPAGIMVHRTPLEKDPEALFAVQLLRNQIGKKVYPLHRLDRPTSGVLLFAKCAASASALQPKFAGTTIKKYYLAVVRGFLAQDHGTVDHPLAKDLEHDLQQARTEYWKLGETEIPFASSNRYDSSRYSLTKIYPHTGRMHQIRRHFAHIRHYIIGDTTHGDNKQNRFFKKHFALGHMLLHADSLVFEHPYTQQTIEVKGEVPSYFKNICSELGWTSQNHGNDE
jgi:tRNA pseudouridine65 synthase